MSADRQPSFTMLPLPLIREARFHVEQRECQNSALHHGELIRECVEKINAEMLALPEEQRPHFTVVQIKEKFGTLRFYADGCTEAIDAAIREAERKRAVPCEVCGSRASSPSLASIG